MVADYEGKTRGNEVLVFLLAVLERIVECLGGRKSRGLLEGSRKCPLQGWHVSEGYIFLLGYLEKRKKKRGKEDFIGR